MEIPNNTRWLTLTIIYLSFVQCFVVFLHDCSRVSRKVECHRVWSSDSFGSKRNEQARELIINSGDNEGWNFSINARITAGKCCVVVVALKEWEVFFRVIVIFTAKASDKIIPWESDMKFYYRNPLRCMMITWKALMWKIHPLVRIKVAWDSPRTHTDAADSKLWNLRNKAGSARDGERKRGMKYYPVINHSLTNIAPPCEFVKFPTDLERYLRRLPMLLCWICQWNCLAYLQREIRRKNAISNKPIGLASSMRRAL